jgi:hypothetical protein
MTINAFASIYLFCLRPPKVASLVETEDGAKQSEAQLTAIMKSRFSPGTRNFSGCLWHQDQGPSNLFLFLAVYGIKIKDLEA